MHALTRLLASCLLAAPALAEESGLGGPPRWSRVAPGADVLQASTGTRSAVHGLTGSEPIHLDVPAAPPAALVMEVFVTWSHHLDGAAPLQDRIVLNGRIVRGGLVGIGTPSLEATKRGTAVYMARGSSLPVELGAANELRGVTDKALAADPLALGSGVTVVVVTRTPGEPLRRVSLWAGYSSVRTSPDRVASARLELARPFSGGDAHLILTTHEGKPLLQDVLTVNRRLAGGVLSGTSGAVDTWSGRAGPLLFGNHYDVVDDNAAEFLAPGDRALWIVSRPAGHPLDDSVAHSLVVLARPEL